MKPTLLFLLTWCLAILTPAASAQLPTVTIVATDAAAAETLPGEPANPGNMRITRTGSTASALTVWVKVSGIAVQGEDYSFGIGTIGTSVVIPAGSSTLDIPVNVIDDWLTEGTEDVRIKLDTKTASGANVPYTIGAADRAVVNIADNEDPLAPLKAIVTVAAIDAVATETPGGTDPMVFRITRTNNLAPALNILYSLGGTATPGTDYPVPPATITIPAGAAFADVTIVPIDDTLIEDPETVIFTLLPTDIVAVPPPAEAYALGAVTTATATIVSDDLPPPPVVTITSPPVNAAAASGQPITVNFTASAVDGYIVSYQVIGGTSASGVTNLPATTAAGTPFNGTANVTFTGNFSFAPLRVMATNNHGVTGTSAVINVYVFIAPPPPPPPPVLPVVNVYPLIGEGAEVSAASGLPLRPASFRVTHNFPATAPVSFLFAIGGTAKEGTDYSLSSAGTITGSFLGRWFTFPAGTTEAEIVVNPIDDLLIESTETVTLSLFTPFFNGFNEGGPNGWEPGTFGFYYGTNYTASVNILDNDTAPPPFPVVIITATDPVGTETVDGSDPVVFTVTRTSGPTNVPLTVNYSLTSLPPPYPYIYPIPAMARSGADFPALPGTITIPAGATSADIVIVPTYDFLAEPDEFVQITLRPSAVAWPDPAGYVLDDHIVATAVIHDATLAAGTPVVWIRVTDALAFVENTPGRTGSFSVERNGNLTDSLTVAYTISGTATNGVNYAALSGSVTIVAGSPRAMILIDPISLAVAGQSESVGLTLQPPPLSASPPYVLSGSSLMQRSVGINILPARPISARARAFYARRYHIILPLPNPPAAPAPAPAAAVAVAAAPTMWTVEASTDFVNWVEIGTTDPSGEYGDFVDVNAGDFASRFYRFRPVATTP